MKSAHVLDEHVLVERAVNTLMKKLGPIETKRFLSMTVNKRINSVKRHRDWQKKLNKQAFFNEVFSDT